MKRFASLLFAALLMNAAHAAPPPPIEPPVEIVNAEFGVFIVRSKDRLDFEPAGVVPHKENQRYGWAIELRTKKRSVSVSEEYVLPSSTPAKVEGADPVRDSLTIDIPRRNQVSQRQLVPVDGKIYGEWAIGPTEPAGKRHLQVYVEGILAADFEFEVK